MAPREEVGHPVASWPLLLDAEDTVEYGEYEGYEVDNDLAEALGEAAWSLGVPLVLAFVAYRALLPHLARVGLARLIPYRLVVMLHAFTGLLLGSAALAHGLLLLPHATPLEWALGALVVFTLAGGVLLLARPGRAARALHAQRLLALALLALAAAHVALRD